MENLEIPAALWIGAAAAVAIPVLYTTFLAPKKEKPWPCVPGVRPFLGNKMDLNHMSMELRKFIIQYGDVPSNTTGMLEVSILGSPLLMICNNKIAAEVMKLRPNKMMRNFAVSRRIGRCCQLSTTIVF